MNASNFGKEVKRAFPNVKKVQTRFGSVRNWVFEGLATNEDSEIKNAVAEKVIL